MLWIVGHSGALLDETHGHSSQWLKGCGSLGTYPRMGSPLQPGGLQWLSR